MMQLWDSNNSPSDPHVALRDKSQISAQADDDARVCVCVCYHKFNPASQQNEYVIQLKVLP